MQNSFNPEHKEGKVATAIEEQTAKIPSDIFLWAALGSMAVSLGLQLAGSKQFHKTGYVFPSLNNKRCSNFHCCVPLQSYSQ
jgi:hypothetical protein